MQKVRMRGASVLIVTLRGLASEVCKNVVLAGIGSLTLLDDQDVSEEDLGSGYFYRDEEVGQKVSRQALYQTHLMLNLRSFTESTISST